MFAYVLSGGRAALNLLLATVLGMFIGGLLATPTTDDAPRAPVVTQPTAAVTEQSVRDLIDEMRALTTATPATPTASSVVAQAEEVLEAVERGEHAMVVDFEDTAATTFTRLRQMGADERVVNQVHHVTPTTRYRDGALPGNVTDLAARCSIVLIDSTGEALAHSGLDQNVDDDVTTWMRHAPRALARLGPAVVLIDHQVKEKESQGRWAIGSHRKLAAIDGVAYTVRLVESFSKVKAGRVKVTCAKDRGGNYGVGVAVPGEVDGALKRPHGGRLRAGVRVVAEGRRSPDPAVGRDRAVVGVRWARRAGRRRRHLPTRSAPNSSSAR